LFGSSNGAPAGARADGPPAATIGLGAGRGAVVLLNADIVEVAA
jgi:hypothetical protein